MSNIAQVARSFVDAFEVRHRSDNKPYHCLKDNSPQWMVDAIFAAHGRGEMMPNDWSYRLIGNVADNIADALERGEDDESEIIISAAYAVVPDYNYERLDWLASHGNRVDILDEFMLAEYDPKLGIMWAIGEAIGRECEEIAATLLRAFEDQAESEEA